MFGRGRRSFNKMELLVKPAKFREAIAKLGKKKRIAKKLSSKQWSQVPTQLRERAFFSANVESAKFLEKAQNTLNDYMTGAREYVINPEGKKVLALKRSSRADFLYEMRKLAKESGMGDLLPPGTDRESRDVITKMKDIQSDARLKLIFDTQTSQAQAYGYYKQGQDPTILDEYPAQRFIRAEGRRVPRSLHRKNTNKVRRKDDQAFWLRMNSQALGGFGVPYGPWGFNSGMDVEDVNRDEAVKLGLIKEDEFIELPEEKFNDTLKASTEKMSPDIQKKLKKQIGNQVSFSDGVVNWKGTRQPPIPPPPPIRRNLFPTLGEIKPVRGLGGSTGAQLVEDAAGERFVMKTGASGEHLLSEASADDAYRVLGFDVPEHKVWESDRPTKLAKFKHGKSLKSFLKGATPAQAAKVKKQIQEGFVADSLLGNWDVVGLEADNILVGESGKVWRIDNGGSLGFRAQGAKKTAAQWGGKVDELETLLDPRLNPQAAEVFSGITEDEIIKQIEAIAEKKNDLLKALPTADRAIVKERIKYLEDYANQRSGPITEAVAKKAKESRGYGYSIKMDKGDIEDTEVLAWQSKGSKAKGYKNVTNVELRLTGDASRRVEDLFKGVEVATTQAVREVGSISGEWDLAFLNAIKSVNYHAGKPTGTANLSKISKLFASYEEIKKAYSKGKIAKADHDYYTKLYLDIKNGHKKKVMATHGFKARNIKPVKKAAPAKAAEKSGLLKNAKKHDELTYPSTTNRKGFITENDDKPHEIGIIGGVKDTPNFEAEIEGVKIKFVPVPEDGELGGYTYAFAGNLQLQVEGGMSKESLDKVRKAMTKLGIDTAKPSKDYEEALYIAKHLRNEAGTTGSDIEKKAFGILKKIGPSDKVKLDEIKKILPAKYKTSLASKNYKPEGSTTTFGVGRRHQTRMDLTPEKITKEMKEHTLIHRSGIEGEKLIDLIMNNGGAVSSITDRRRLGQTWAGGDSAATDIDNGVADYFFTRIWRKKDLVSKYKDSEDTRYAFKIGNLARLDAQPFEKDWAGGVRQIYSSPEIRKVRKKTIAAFKDISSLEGNETLFRHGLNFLDDIEHIYTNDHNAAGMLKVLKKHKVTKLPDGRKIEEIFIHRHTGKKIYE
jgi:hypothetical protein